MKRSFLAPRRPRGKASPGRGKPGQAMIEYLVTAAMLVLCLSIFAVFLYTLKEQGGRVLNLVALDYP